MKTKMLTEAKDIGWILLLFVVAGVSIAFLVGIPLAVVLFILRLF